MSRKVGDIDYTEEEYLKYGADCYSKNGEKAELVLIESNTKDSDLEISEEMLYDTKHSLEGRYIAAIVR